MHNLGKNALEWSVFGVSCLLVLSLLSFLGYASLTHTDSPPRIEFHLGKPANVEKTWQVEVEVENKGGQAIEGVEIEVEWAATKQTANFVLPHLPIHGKRVGYAVFEVKGETRPSSEALKARVLGFEEG